MDNLSLLRNLLNEGIRKKSKLKIATVSVLFAIYHENLCVHNQDEMPNPKSAFYEYIEN